ncbi:DUF134 domain-containing protein [Chlorobium phaeobacteroides]|uniref:UPF0251 protein Cpha266_1003 n=1 Tax=Chlorobium phaeobacteroides (strain DSM 266 / SMG 266 / 2430) TaxID=290317 RepID=A1BF73_CHLPD|nr:DUF134 domain-containing protein [Chlorobium phaeobacteroides]ABL65050.1 protein of unknown function DUF134 [Chlorobium phaeobacteroides DSM 266]
MKHNRAGRPVSCRSIEDLPKFTCFKPDGISLDKLQSVILSVDELEALRLADKLGLYQATAAERMKVSRQTFGRIIESAHRKVAEAIIEGKSICIEGGTVQQICGSDVADVVAPCVCLHCGYEEPHLEGVPCRTHICPECSSPLIRKGRCSSVV